MKGLAETVVVPAWNGLIAIVRPWRASKVEMVPTSSAPVKVLPSAENAIERTLEDRPWRAIRGSIRAPCPRA